MDLWNEHPWLPMVMGPVCGCVCFAVGIVATLVYVYIQLWKNWPRG